MKLGKQYYEISDALEGQRIDIFNENWYKYKEEFYPSVTFILSQVPDNSLVYWFKQVGMNADIIRDRAGEIGSEFHRAVEILLKTGEIDYKAIEPKYILEVWTRINNFWSFAKKHLKNKEILKIEYSVFNHDLKYAGTVDLLTNSSDGYEIWDWKTSKDVHESHKIQLSAYAHCIENIQRCNIVIFPDNPKTQQGYSICTLDQNQITEYFKLFRWYKEDFDRNKKKPKFQSLPTKFIFDLNND